jgi:hypothetical protein
MFPLIPYLSHLSIDFTLTKVNNKWPTCQVHCSVIKMVNKQVPSQITFRDYLTYSWYLILLPVLFNFYILVFYYNIHLLKYPVNYCIFTKLYNCHHYLIPEHFHHSQKKSHSHQQSYPMCCSTQTSLSLLMSLLWIFHINRITQYVLCGSGFFHLV